MTAANPGAIYACINYGEAYTSKEIADRSICIDADIGEVVEQTQGIRRSGKSELMRAYTEYLKDHFENINIIFVDFMDLAYEELKEYHALHTYVEKHMISTLQVPMLFY